MPLPVPIPPSPDASQALLAAFAERGIDWHPERRSCAGSIPGGASRCSATAREMPYDLFLGVPEAPGAGGRRGSRALTVDGWIPVDPLTLRRRSPACTRSAT